jgi:spermidine synthase
MSHGLWIHELFDEKSSFGLKVIRSLHLEQSDFQRIEIVETSYLGRVLVLDGVFQTSEVGEHVYHEMIVHPAMCVAPRVERVLVIGGGDGGTAREVLRHPGVKRCVMVEIDERVVRACQEHLPHLGGGAWDDPRLELRFENGVAYVKHADVEPFDVVILDGSDPVGPSEGLFDRAFYEGARRLLRDGGVFAMQSESPTVYEEVFYDLQRTARDVFGHAHPYFGSVLLYAAGMWTWTVAGVKDPREPIGERVAPIADGCSYYNAEVHRAAFAQPSFIARRLRG